VYFEHLFDLLKLGGEIGEKVRIDGQLTVPRWDLLHARSHLSCVRADLLSVAQLHRASVFCTSCLLIQPFVTPSLGRCGSY
jgi:hypothetical protein